MDGDFIVEQGSIADVLAIVLNQPDMLPRWSKAQWWLRYLIRHWQQFNPSRAKRNVASHYDLDGRLYRLFLDADMQYSCAYFETPDSTLDDAQLARSGISQLSCWFNHSTACSISAVAGVGSDFISRT